MSLDTQDELERAAERVRVILTELIAETYERSQKYTAIVIFGGYAALFAIWSNVRDVLTPTQVAQAGTLLGISVLAFVLFEVVKMVTVTIDMMTMRKIISQPMDADEFAAARVAHSQKANRFVVFGILPFWVAVLILTVGTGVGAAYVLLSAFWSILFAV